jgi:WD40 repeat protein/serine/threonine protein kinase/class 3 adenylate cyclase
MSETNTEKYSFPDAPEGTVTFLFTDIEGSTRLLNRLRDQYAPLLAEQRRLLRDAFIHWNGREVDTQGDAFFVAFPRATESVRAAVESQRALASHPWPDGVEVRVRMGLHTGEPWKAEEGYVGMDVHRAARIAHLGYGGQVLLSETTAALVRDELPDGVSLLDLGEHRLKDIRRPEHIQQLVIDGLPSEFEPLKSLKVLPPLDQERVIRGFQLRERLGEGNFGEVYRAYQIAVSRDVAVKVIRPKYADDPEFIRRFEYEAKTIARLEHPHIVPLYDYWREPAGAYIIMRWLRGGSLEDALIRGGWRGEVAARLVDQVASALSYAHRLGVIHRDIKPANILLDDQGNAYLSDFGIATLTGPLDALVEVQETNWEITTGSLGYLSPEVAVGGKSTHLADIYSCGVVLYELVTGQRPFPGVTGSALLEKHRLEPLPSVREVRSELPAAVDQVIQQATAKNPADRYTNVLVLAQAFRSALAVEAAEQVVPLPIELEPVPVNPYKGLRAFQEADANDFFGREAMTSRLVVRMLSPEEAPSMHGRSLAEGRFLAVVGPSGSGKSSLVKAGLIPALRRGEVPGSDKWFITEMTPGMHPFEELEAALLRVAINPPPSLLDQLQNDARGLVRATKRILPADEKTELLLLVDQFEELFTLVEDPAISKLFLNSLYAAVTEPRSRLRVMITLRADFYDRPLLYPEFSELVRQLTEVVVPLTSEELSRAIQEPARRVRVVFEEGLVTRMVTEVNEQPGVLPLLQYSLTELFERRQVNLLTQAAYKELGGVLGALGLRAEQLYQDLDPNSQNMTRQLFLRLVTLGEGTEDTRRRVLLSEFENLTIEESNRKSINIAMEIFSKHRLLTFDRDPQTRSPTIEVAHEALLREWRRLREWSDESRADVRMQRALANSAKDWSEAGKDPSFLMRGARLDQFEAWASSSALVFTIQEQEYLQTSTAERQARQAEEELRQAHERALEQRSRRFLRALVGVMLVATVVALILAGLARSSQLKAQSEAQARATQQNIAESEADARATQQSIAEAEVSARATQQNIAESERQRAENQAKLAFSRELAAAALTNIANDQERAVLLAIQALKEADTQQAEEALHRTVQELRIIRTLERPGSWIGLAWSSDGKRLAASGTTGIVVLDPESGKILYSKEITEGMINRLAFRPDGTLLVLPTEGGDATAKSNVSIWEADTGKELLTFAAHDAYVQHVSFNPAGTQFATASGDGTVKVWDLAKTLASGEGKSILTVKFGEELDVPWAVWFSPDGAYLATANGDGKIHYLDAVSGRELWQAPSDAYDFRFSPDGARMVVSGSLGMLDVLEAATGKRLSRTFGHTLNIENISISPDGSRVATSCKDGTVKIWAFSEDALSPLMTLSGHKDQANGVAFSPDGGRLASEGSGGDGTIRIWDISPSGSVEPIIYQHMAPVQSVAFSPDGTRLATGATDGTAFIWEALSGKSLHDLSGQDWIWRVAYNPEGDLVATAGHDATLKLWDTDTGTVLSTLVLPTDQPETFFFRGILAAAFSPNSERLATAGGDGAVKVWDVASMRKSDLGVGDELFSLAGPGEMKFALDVAFSPDGRWIAATLGDYVTFLGNWNDGMIKVWDTATNQLVWTLNAAPPYVYSTVSFSQDGQRLAAGDIGGQAIVWRLPDNREDDPEELFTIKPGNFFVWKLNFSPDGAQLAVPYSEGMGIWDANTGEPIGTLPHPGSTFEAVYSPDGKRLATAGSDAGRLFFLDINELVAMAKARLTRSLTTEECQKYLHMEECPASD